MNRTRKKSRFQGHCRIMYYVEKTTIFFKIRLGDIFDSYNNTKAPGLRKITVPFSSVCSLVCACVLLMHFTCFSVCLVPFLKAGWLGVTLSL